MAIEPPISIALSVHAHKGIYALLLGSGISRAAGIPTGYEVIKDLAKRIATAANEDAGDSADVWYRSKFGKEAKYSELIEEIAPTAAERMSLLRGYFEPTDDQREQGLKVPTAAHRAVARLVAAGFVKVIVTTNFDRLLEQSLHAEGVDAYVVASADQISGMMPLAHVSCLIVKIHGDYLDTRIRNTPTELAAYDSETDALLDRIFSEYGLIVCGWSCARDPALAGAIIRNTRFRFSTYWMARGDLESAAADLVHLRRATVVRIDSADQGFVDLEAKVTALAEGRIGDPMSPLIALAMIKRYLAEDKYRIQLEGLIVGELNAAREQCGPAVFPEGNPVPDEPSFRSRVEQMEVICGKLIPIVAAAVYWGERRVDGLISRCLVSLLRTDTVTGSSYSVWSKLQFYPGTLVCYAAGIAALLRGRFDLIKSLLLDTVVHRPYHESKSVINLIGSRRVLHDDAAQWLDPLSNGRKTPSSDWMAKRLKPILSDVFGADAEFDDQFDLFEVLLMLISADQEEWVQVGRFAWRGQYSGHSSVYRRLIEEVQTQAIGHPILQCGLFDGKLDRFNAAVEKATPAVQHVAF